MPIKSKDLHLLADSTAQEIRHQLHDAGIYRFVAADKAEYHDVVSSLGQIRHVQTSDEDGVTVVAPDPNGRPQYNAMGTATLTPHTDSSGVPSPPGGLALMCDTPADRGGEPVLVDGYQVFSMLEHQDPKITAALLTPESAIFRTGQQTTVTSIFEHDATGKLRVRLRLDGLAYFREHLVPYIPALRQAVAECAVSFPLAANEGYVIDNRRFLHGRLSFEGPRRMLRLLLDL